MVTNVSTTVTPNPKLSISSRAPSPSPARVKRAPLLPSESDNNVPLPRKPKPRDVSSRYLSSTASISTTMTSTSSSGSFSSTTTTTSSSTSNSNYNYNSSTPRRRFPSPLVSSTNLMTPSTVTVNNKRAQSTERRRPKTPTVTAKMLTALPARNLSVSFQGPSFAVPLNKVTKPPPNNINNNNNNNNSNNNNINRSRNSTPDKRPVTPVRKLGNNNSSSSSNNNNNNNNNNSVDQKRWPAARSRQGSFMTRSVDFTNENIKLSGSGTATAIRERISKDKDNKHEIPEVNRSIDKLISDFNNNADRVVSDAESVSSGSTTPSTVRGGRARGITVPARFMQETVNRLRRVQPEPVSPPLRNNRPVSGNRYLRDGPVQSPRGLSPSPVRGAVRPASPCKSVPLGSAASPARGMASPTRGRSAIGSSGNLGNPHSILSFAAESRRRKVGDNAINDAHVLRMLHNKYLQWRFANARADGAMLVKRATAQKSLYNSWVTTSKMRQSVISKRMEIQQLRQNLKLYTVLKTKMSLLKVWDQVERDHIVSLSGTIGSLESTTLRVPLVDGAKVDVQSLKDAMRSAADVMQAVASLIRSLVTKVEHVNALASELASTTTNERSALDQCKDLLSILTHMEVQDCSVRTHVLQLQPPSSTALTEL